MAMVVRTNYSALNATRHLNKNQSGVAGSIEKLSSGFKVNRAADDAAGLAISEKMKAQIKALDVAVNNAEDGIGLIQTTEGYLDSIHSMLNRMVELAEKSANGIMQAGEHENVSGANVGDVKGGVHDTIGTLYGIKQTANTDRDALQSEMNQLCAEIDRVAATANFNKVKLFTGNLATEEYDRIRNEGQYTNSADAIASISRDIDLALRSDKSIQNAKNAMIEGYANINTAQTALDTAKGDTILLRTLQSALQNTVDTLKITKADPEIDSTSEFNAQKRLDSYIADLSLLTGDGKSIDSLAKLADYFEGLVYESALVPVAVGQDFSGFFDTTTGLLVKGADAQWEELLDEVTLVLDAVNAAISHDSVENPTDPDDRAAGLSALADYQDALDALAAAQAAYDALDPSDTNYAIDEGIAQAAIDDANAALASIVLPDFGGLQELLNAELILTKPLETDYYEAIETLYNEIAGRAGLKVEFDRATGDNEKYVTSWSVDMSKVDTYKDWSDPANVGGKVYGEGLILQIGETSNAADKLAVSVGRLHTDTLFANLTNPTVWKNSDGKNDVRIDINSTSQVNGVIGYTIDISGQQRASAAAEALNSVINDVSMQRASLGAMQNRLDYTIDNLNTASENMQAANSRIRDTDMAKEMTKFTMQNVLLQAAQSMLSQANAQPQNVLSLLR